MPLSKGLTLPCMTILFILGVLWLWRREGVFQQLRRAPKRMFKRGSRP